MGPRESLALQSVAPGHDFEFDADCILHSNYRACLHLKCRKHRRIFDALIQSYQPGARKWDTPARFISPTVPSRYRHSGNFSLLTTRPHHKPRRGRCPTCHAGGPLKPGFGLSGEVPPLDRVCLPLVRVFVPSILTRSPPVPHSQMRSGENCSTPSPPTARTATLYRISMNIA